MDFEEYCTAGKTGFEKYKAVNHIALNPLPVGAMREQQQQISQQQPFIETLLKRLEALGSLEKPVKQ